MEKNWEREELPPQGRAQQLAVQCQTVNHESKHAGSTIWTEQVILYACNDNLKQGVYTEGLEGRRGKGKML